MVRTAIMRVRSGDYRAALYLANSSYLFRWLARCRVAASLDMLESAAIALMLCRGCGDRAQGCLVCLRKH